MSLRIFFFSLVIVTITGCIIFEGMANASSPEEVIEYSTEPPPKAAPPEPPPEPKKAVEPPPEPKALEPPPEPKALPEPPPEAPPPPPPEENDNSFLPDKKLIKYKQLASHKYNVQGVTDIKGESCPHMSQLRLW